MQRRVRQDQKQGKRTCKHVGAWKVMPFCMAIAGATLTAANPVLAQSTIIPDTTLGAENSTVNQDVMIRGMLSDRVEGGAARGINLFHSFEQFNVGVGRGVYFANPAGIENILSRVTGSNRSEILGRLGVLGNANLFLLNPNGILFGANASLDLTGSFTATTANAIQLGDRGFFSATQPQQSTLLAVAPGALLYNQIAAQGGRITNAGNLAAGQDLTLAANTLDLQGQLQAGRDLTLQAQDTVRIRDSATTPFVASAGRNLLVQGNQTVDIFALNHPNSGLFSGGDMVMRSANQVGGDAHYRSGGNFRIEQLDGSLGNLYSPYDPVFEVAGDFSIASYSGGSLQILAGGSVTIPGDVTVNAPGTPFNNSSVVLSDGTSVTLNGSTIQVLDIRAGTTTFFGTPTSGTPTSANINLGGINTVGDLNNPGITLLTNQFSPNALKGSITLAQTLGGYGSVYLDSRGDITTDIPSGSIGGIDTSTSSGNAGEIRLLAAGSIDTTKGFLSSAATGINGNGGAITLTATGGSITTNALISLAGGVSGNGGAIKLTATGGSIATSGLFSYSFPDSGNSGDGGTVTLSATGGITINGNISSASITESGSSGTGGKISLTATNGSISTGNLRSFSFTDPGDSGSGGSIRLTANNGNISTGDLVSSSFGRGGNSESGGEITVSAIGGNILTGDLKSFSQNSLLGSTTGSGGAISFVTTGDISTGNLSSATFSDTAGAGGAISLITTGGNISTGELSSFTVFYNERSNGTGGSIKVSAARDISTGNLSSGATNASFNTNYPANVIGGEISIFTTGGKITTGTLDSASFAFASDSGNGGKIVISAIGGITIGATNSSSYSFFGNSGDGGSINLTTTYKNIYVSKLISFSNSHVGDRSGNGGNIFLIARDGNIIGTDPVFDNEGNPTGNSSILASFAIIDSGPIITNSGQRITEPEQGVAGKGGNVTLEAKNSVANLEILTLSSSSTAGAVTIKGLEDLSINNTRILTSKQLSRNNPSTGFQIIVDIGKSGRAGDVSVTSLGNLSFNNSSIQSDTKGIDPAGNVTVISPGFIIFNDSQIISSTSSTGQAGNISVTADQGITLTGSTSGLFAQTNSPGKAGNITLTTPQLTLQPGTQISTTAAAAAANPDGGGSITLNTSNLDLAGIVGIFAETQGQTPAGTLRLNPYNNQPTLTITLAPESKISAATAGSGNGGDLILTAPQAITISGQGKLAVETTGSGNAGNITIATQQLTLKDGVELSASTSGSGKAGNLAITADNFNLLQRAKITTTTSSSGKGGDITINLSRDYRANDGQILATADRSGGGSINIIANNIRLQGNSDIKTNVFSGASDGGNITLTARSILAFDDSDILAFAQDGQGGNITLNTRAFFGQNYRPTPFGTNPRTLDDNNRVDINASGAVSGIVTLPDVSFIQNSLTQLPQVPIDTNTLLANSCIVRRNQPTGNFFITGSGGLPERPGTAASPAFPTGEVQNVAADVRTDKASPPSASSVSHPLRRPWKIGDPIAEPDGVYQLPDGQLVLSHACP